MKTLPILIVALAFLLSACEKENEIISKNANQTLNAFPERIVDGISETDEPVIPDGCLKFSTIHWLKGSGKYEPIHQKAFETDASQRPSMRYVIEASGDAASEILARGNTTLYLVYDTQDRHVTGFLRTGFYFGEFLEAEIDGDAALRFDGKEMILRAQIKSANLFTDKGRFVLQEGEITFNLPSIPDGSFEVNIDTEMVVCL